MSCSRRTYLPDPNLLGGGLPTIPTDPNDWEGMRRLLDEIKNQLEGKPSNATPPGVIQNFVATTLSGGTLLTWDKQQNTPHYIIFRGVTNNFSQSKAVIIIASDSPAGSQFFDPCGQEAAGTRIYYWVQGWNQGGGGPLSITFADMVDCGGGFDSSDCSSADCDFLYGEPPPPTGAIVNAADARVVSSPDSDFVTLSEITTPIAIYGPIEIVRSLENTAGQAATFRLYINDILVDERAHTFTASASVGRGITLGWRAPGDVGVDGNAVGIDYADFSAGTYNDVNVDDVARHKHMPLALVPNKIRIDMKATAATVSSTYTAFYRYHPVAVGNPTIWTGQVRSYRATRSLAASPTGSLDSVYVSTLNITTPGQMIGLAFGRITSAVVGSAVVGVQLKINGAIWDTFETSVSAANTEYSLFGTTPPFGAKSALDGDGGNNLHNIDSYLLLPSVRFNTFEMLTKFVSRSGGTTTATARVFALIAPV